MSYLKEKYWNKTKKPLITNPNLIKINKFVLDFWSGKLGVQDGDREIRVGLPEVRQVQTQRSNQKTLGRYVGGERREKGKCFCCCHFCHWVFVVVVIVVVVVVCGKWNKHKDQTRKHLDNMWVAREGRKVNSFGFDCCCSCWFCCYCFCFCCCCCCCCCCCGGGGGGGCGGSEKAKLKDQTRKHLDDMWVAIPRREKGKTMLLFLLYMMFLFLLLLFMLLYLFYLLLLLLLLLSLYLLFLLLSLLFLLLCGANETNSKIKAENTWTTCYMVAREGRNSKTFLL